MSTSRRLLWPVYVAESFSSVGSTLLTIGIFFYTEHYFHWTLRQNLLLSAAQGCAYVVGSLSSHAIAVRLGRRWGLIAVLAALTVLPLVALAAGAMVPALIVYMFFASLVWPMLESLVASDADAHTISHRVGIYNLVWSATNVVTLAVSGTIITYWPAGLFIVPAAAHLLSAVMIGANAGVDPGESSQPSAHSEPEPELLAQRTQALWLSRIALPATYVVVYSLSAMLPLLAVMQPLDTAQRTIVGSIWMAARWLVFAALMASAWWHTRPRILLLCAAVMLVAFLGVTIRPSELPGFAQVGQAVDLASMIGWQIVLGVVMGIIYAASLYFGMVLSEGSTEHGGYHEALIGAGSVIGPASAALTQWRWPGDITAGVIAVASVVALTVAAAGALSLRSRRPTE